MINNSTVKKQSEKKIKMEMSWGFYLNQDAS